MSSPGFQVDYLTHIYHSLKFYLDESTVPEYSSTSASGGTPRRLRDLIPGVVIEPEILARERRNIMDGKTPFCIFAHRNILEGAETYFGGAYEQEILWEIQAYPGSGGLRKKIVMEGWVRTLLQNKRAMPIYEFLYDTGTGQITKSSQVIGYMRIFDVRSLDAASVTYLEPEEAHSILNFIGRVRKVNPSGF